MPSKIKYDVILTTQAIELLKDDPIFSFLTKGKYFKCLSIEPNGNYLFMKLEYPFKFEGVHVYEISIPHSYVLYFVSFDSDIHPGLHS